MNTSEAILKLRPEAEFSVVNDKIIWQDETQTEPTAEEIQQCISDNEYADKRRKGFPSWQDQLDYIYNNGVEAWKTEIIKPIKDKYPKGE